MVANFGIEELKQLKLDFPTLLPVKEKIVKGQVQMFTLNLTSKSRFPLRIIVDCPDPAKNLPTVYYRNPLWLPPKLLCIGQYWNTYAAESCIVSRLSGFLNHTISVFYQNGIILR